MIKYGLISATDASTLEKTIDLICDQFIGQEINVTEIGIFDGQTARGLYEYVTSKAYLFGDNISDTAKMPMNSANFKCNYTAIDNEKDKLIKLPFPECKFIRGNSSEVYNQLEDESQHLIFVDGCHCFAHVISDFFCYAPKVKMGGYIAFHDTGKHIKPFKDFQHGDKSNPDAYISVRKALESIALFRKGGMVDFKDATIALFGEMDIKEYREQMEMIGWVYKDGFIYSQQFKLVFDEADIENEAGGVCVFKKLY